MTRPLCLVVMPCGSKTDAAGCLINFDAVYQELILPAIDAAGLVPLRADQGMTHEIIEKAALERLMLCDYAVVDLSGAGAGVYYQLGARHAVRSGGTILIHASGSPPPVEATNLRSLSYSLNASGSPEHAEATGRALADRLREAMQSSGTDSPIYELVEDFRDIQRLKTDVFRERVDYEEGIKQRLAESRRKGAGAVRAVEQEIGAIDSQESGVVIDLFLSYRAVRAWQDMIRLAEAMTPPLAATVMVREQLALALNRAGQPERAEQILLDLINRRGGSSETYGILGRIYKDMWEADRKRGETDRGRALLDKAIEAYLHGFEADWRDAYPGINAVTLMELRDPPDSRREKLIPVVAYAVERRLAAGKPDYWDHATRLELAVLARDRGAAEAALADALANVREIWEPESTARNLRLIREARGLRGETVSWADEMEAALRSAKSIE